MTERLLATQEEPTWQREAAVPTTAVGSKGRTKVAYAAVTQEEIDWLKEQASARERSLSEFVYAIVKRATKGFTDPTLVDGPYTGE